MKLRTKLSPRQKNTLKKTPQVLMALLILGVLSTQINNDKDLDSLNDREQELIAPKVNELEEVQEMTLVEEAPSQALEEEILAEEEIAAAPLPSKTQKVARTKSIVQTSSAVAYTSMKMELNNYTGKLRWGSSFQRNIKKFVVERSVDDEIYTEIGSIAGEGKGEYSQEKSYELEDKDLMMVEMPRIFYRIKQEGIAGDSDYSDVIEYDLGAPEGIYARVKLNPNKQLRIQYSTPMSGTLAYKILDAFGEPVSEGELQGEFDPQSFTLETQNWKRGTYYLQLDMGEHSFSEAFAI